ncbi:MAG: formate dehydrogenase accessory sulfurtransferase FdhD [Thermodesulfobacteriota bacterium]
MSDPLTELPLWRYREGRVQKVPDQVVVEEPLEIRLAGEPFQMLMRLPGLEKELALGFLFTEGIVRDLAEVITIHFCGTATDPLLPPNVVDVILTQEALERRGRRHLEVAYSSCGLCAKEAVDEIRRKVPPVASTLTLSPDVLLALMNRLLDAQPVFQATGGTHAVALASPDGRVFLSAEDVGRHNAMDKVIGRALLEKRKCGEMAALLSGRLSFEMALKAARAGLPILAAVSAPTTTAIELARELNLTLVGFVRDNRLNIYTHPQRLGVE